MLKSRARLIVALAALLATAGGTAAGRPDAARLFLAEAFDVAPVDVARLDAGRVVSRTLPSSERREVATLGVVRMAVPPAFYIQRLLDITSFKQSDAVVQIGRFSTPPAASDVAALSLDDGDYGQLRECRIGDCGVQLPASAIERFRREVDWRRSDARQRANAVMREVLVDYVTAYSAGPAADMRYADGPARVDVRHEVGQLAAADRSGWKHFPVLSRHILLYPVEPAAGVTDLIYWSREKVSSRTVVSITHLSIAPIGGSAAEFAVASKQIYGTHYFDASLGLTVLVPDRAATAATYVAYLNRSRIDLFDGFFGGMTRGIVSGKARGTVSDHLAELKARLEREFAAAPAPR